MPADYRWSINSTKPARRYSSISSCTTSATRWRAGSGLKILAVTVLTSYDDGDLQAAGYRLSVSDLVDPGARPYARLGLHSGRADGAQGRRSQSGGRGHPG